MTLCPGRPSPWSSSNIRSRQSKVSVGSAGRTKKSLVTLLCSGVVAFVFAIVLAAATFHLDITVPAA
jgi:hypothetical protein